MNNILKNKSLLIFDLDETIYDHRYSSISGLKAVAKTYPQWNSHSLEKLETIYFNELHQIHLKVIDGHISDEDAHLIRFQKLAEHCHLNFTDNELLNMIQIYNSVSKKEKRPIPEAPETVFALKKMGFAMGIITNGPTVNQKQKIKFCKVQDHMNFTLISEEIGIRKPAKEIFEKALQIAGVNADQAIMIGDSWDSDITGALKANILPIWINRGRHQNFAPQEVFEIDHINQLLKN